MTKLFRERSLTFTPTDAYVPQYERDEQAELDVERWRGMKEAMGNVTAELVRESSRRCYQAGLIGAGDTLKAIADVLTPQKL